MLQILLLYPTEETEGEQIMTKPNHSFKLLWHFWGLFGDLFNKHVFFKIILLGRECKNGSFSGLCWIIAVMVVIEAPQREELFLLWVGQLHFCCNVVQGQLSLMLKLSYVWLHKHQLSSQWKHSHKKCLLKCINVRKHHSGILKLHITVAWKQNKYFWYLEQQLYYVWYCLIILHHLIWFLLQHSQNFFTLPKF